MMELLPNEIVIDDSNYTEHIDVVVDGERMGHGYVPRDYSRFPVGSYAKIEPFAMNVIPRSEWSSRIRDMEQSKSRLSDLRDIGDNGQPIVSLDQNGQGYCWSYSPASAIMLARARDNQPYVRLSAHAVACKIKNYRDQGGWNPQAVEYAIKYGYPDVEHWPEKSMNRAHDKAATWTNAAQHKITEGFMDLIPAIYDRNLSFDQFFTCLLSRIPCPSDYMWWRHSVCACDPLEFDSTLPLSDINRWGARIWNSWRDAYGARGMAALRGKKSVPDGCTAVKGIFQR